MIHYISTLTHRLLKSRSLHPRIDRISLYVLSSAVPVEYSTLQSSSLPYIKLHSTKSTFLHYTLKLGDDLALQLLTTLDSSRLLKSRSKPFYSTACFGTIAHWHCTVTSTHTAWWTNIIVIFAPADPSDTDSTLTLHRPWHRHYSLMYTLQFVPNI